MKEKASFFVFEDSRAKIEIARIPIRLVAKGCAKRKGTPDRGYIINTEGERISEMTVGGPGSGANIEFESINIEQGDAISFSGAILPAKVGAI